MKPEDTQENFDVCGCPGCPMYSDCNEYENERLFCSRGVSKCPMGAGKDCICEACAVYLENKLQGKYFCSKGG